MQATYDVRRSSFTGAALLFAIVFALFLGALAGYWAKSLSAQVAAPARAATVVSIPAAAPPSLSVQHRSGLLPGTLKGAGEDSTPAVKASAPVVSGAGGQQRHRIGGIQE